MQHSVIQHADMSIRRCLCCEQASDEMWCNAGEQSVREANAARFKQTCQREFEAFKKERLATGELECQKLITAAQSHLTQVQPLPSLAASLQTTSSLHMCYGCITMQTHG